MSDDEIDLDRVVSDPAYRRRVIEYLNVSEEGDGVPQGSAVRVSARRAAQGEAAPASG